MSVEFIGMIQTRRRCPKPIAAQGPVIDIDYVRAVCAARTKHAGFDRILVPHQSTSPDALLTIAHAASVTQGVHFMLAHRPGFVAPTLAARQTRDARSLSGRPARRALHLGRQRRRSAPRRRLPLARRTLRPHRRVPAHPAAHLDRSRAVRSPRPATTASSRPSPKSGPMQAAACSDLLRRRVRTGDRSRRQARGCLRAVGRVEGASARAGRRACAPRPRSTAAACASRYRSGRFSPTPKPPRGSAPNTSLPRRGGCARHKGSAWVPRAERRRAAAARGRRRRVRVDERLWTGVAKEIGGRSNSTALVGTPAQVAETLAAVSRTRRVDVPDPRLRSARRRHRLRPRTDSRHARTDRARRAHAA